MSTRHKVTTALLALAIALLPAMSVSGNGFLARLGLSSDTDGSGGFRWWRGSFTSQGGSSFNVALPMNKFAWMDALEAASNLHFDSHVSLPFGELTPLADTRSADHAGFTTMGAALQNALAVIASFGAALTHGDAASGGTLGDSASGGARTGQAAALLNAGRSWLAAAECLPCTAASAAPPLRITSDGAPSAGDSHREALVALGELPGMTISALGDAPADPIVDFSPMTLNVADNGSPGARIALDDASATAVPEPTTWMLLALGVLGIATSRRRA